MPLVASAFLLPLGTLDASRFPLTDKEEREGTYADEDAKAEALIGQWIAQAEAAYPDSEATQTLFVYARAHAAAYATAVNRPASASADGEGSYSFTTAQLNALKAARDDAEAALAEVTAPAPVVVPRSSPTGQIPTHTRW